MRNRFAVTALIVGIASTSFAQSGWIRQMSGTTRHLRSVHFADTGIGWAVGDSGTILHTIDGGTDWQPQPGGTSRSLRSVYFANRDTGWIAGDAGTILITANGGSTWRSVSSGTTRSLNSIHFPEVSMGLSVGFLDSIRVSADGGLTWSSRSTGRFNNLYVYSLYDVYFANASTGWAVGEGRNLIPGGGGPPGIILKTIDSGNTWSLMYSDTTRTYNGLRSVYFLNSDTGWVAGGLYPVPAPSPKAAFFSGVAAASGNILKTTDGGITWFALDDGVTTSNPFRFWHSIHFVDADTGWVVGEFGVAKSINGGITWVPESLGVTQAMNSVYFANPNLGWIVGDNGAIFKTAVAGTPVSGGEARTDFSLIRIGKSLYFRLPRASRVQVTLYDLRGKAVARLLDARRQSGAHVMDLTATGLPRGLYLLQFRADGRSRALKWVLQ